MPIPEPWPPTFPQWFTDHIALFSGAAVSIGVGLFVWAFRNRKAIPAYLPIPWVPLRYFAALRKDKRLRLWSSGSATIQAIETSAVYVSRNQVPLLHFLKRNVNEGGRVLVLGEPGCGKTATFEALTFDLATQAFRRALLVNLLGLGGICLLAVFVSFWMLILVPIVPLFYRLLQGVPFPVFIELRNLQEKSLELQLIETLRNCDGGEWLIHRLNRLVSKGRIALIFDGVNELTSERHELFERGWADLVAAGSRFGKCPAFLSSRELMAGPLPATVRVAVCDLDDAGVRRCLQYYGSPDVERDFATLDSQNMLRDFGIGRNPYWLRMMVLSDLYTANRGALFENFARTLLRKERKDGDPAIDDQMSCLARIARFMADKGSVGADLTDIETLGAAENPNFGLMMTRAEGAMLTRRSPRNRRFEFTHHLVQEFFTAYSLINEETEVFQHLDDYAWWGAFVMLGGLTDEHVVDGSKRVGDRAKFRRLVLSMSDYEGSGHASLLALGLLWTVDKPDPNLQARVAEALIRVMSAESMAPAAIGALMKVAEDAVLDGLGRFLDGPANAEAKRHLLRTLARVRSAKIAKVAIARLPDSQLREEAEAALIEIAGPAVKPILETATNLVHEEGPLLRLLTQMGTLSAAVLIDEITSDSSNYHPIALRALAMADASSSELLIDSLRRDLTKDARERVKYALTLQADVAIPGLWGAFLRSDDIIRSGVTDVLEYLGPKVVPFASSTWGEVEKSPQAVRMAAATLLGKTGDPRIAPLLQKLRRDVDAEVQSSATSALTDLDRAGAESARWQAPDSRVLTELLLTLRTFIELGVLAAIFLGVGLVVPGGISMPLTSAALFAFIFELCLLLFGVPHAPSLRRNLAATPRQSLTTFVSICIAAIYLGTIVRSWQIPAAALISVPFISVLRIYFAKKFLGEHLKLRVLVLGAGRVAQSLASLRRRTDLPEMQIVGYLDTQDAEVKVTSAVMTLAGTSLLETCRRYGIDEVVVALDEQRGTLPTPALFELQESGLRITRIDSVLESATGRIWLDLVNPTSLLYSNRFKKLPVDFRLRIVDAFGGALLLLLAAPMLMLTLFAIKIEEGWRAPVFYAQTRVGRHGRHFRLLKFRSMRTDAESDGRAKWAAAGDSRVTRVGAFLRKLRIDELPQCWNLLTGDLSLVGPAPQRPEFTKALTESIPYYAQRNCVPPGITGWAQVCYPYGSSEHDLSRKLEYDLFYIKHRSVLFYLQVLIASVGVILFARSPVR